MVTNITDITDMQLEKILHEIVIPGSTIGLHGISTSGDGADKYKSIENSGLKNNTAYGIVGTVEFINLPENPTKFNISDITQYRYGVDGNQISYTVIIAIPEVLELSDGQVVYLGRFLKYHMFGKDDERAIYVPINWIKNIPSEFIVGAYTKNLKTHKTSFTLNKNYLGLKENKQQQAFATNFYTNFFELTYNFHKKKLLTFDEETIDFIKKLISSGYDENFYYNSFIEKYDTLKKRTM